MTTHPFVKEGVKMRTAIQNIAAALAVALLALPVAAFADKDEKDEAKEGKEHDELSRAMRDAKLPLERGVSSAAAKEGTPATMAAAQRSPTSRRDGAGTIRRSRRSRARHAMGMCLAVT